LAKCRQIISGSGVDGGAKMHGDAAGYVGNIPDHYDRGVGPVLMVDFADDLARQVAAVAPERVLETAAGTGILTRRLRDLLPATARLIATDLNQPMLDTAKAKFAADEKVDFQEADATALPFGEGVFDAVVCQFGVMFFPDKAKSYREAHRVLAPGGRYFFSVWDAHRHNAFARILHQGLADHFPKDPPRFFEVPFAYHAIDTIKDALAEAGFTDLRVAVLSRVKEVPDLSAFAKGQVYGSPVFDQIGARGGHPNVVVAAFETALHREFGKNPSRVPLQTIVFEARRAG
jgi:ubiquinone/menaquinone biosynthesis C-methylase UbiE